MTASTDTIYFTLNDLLERKSKRDNIKFTGSQLAQAINVKRSIIHRLIHPNPTKRVTNPKIETLIKISEFFRLDGFDVKIDDFLSTHEKTVDIQEQVLGMLSVDATLPLYSLKNPKTLRL